MKHVRYLLVGLLVAGICTGLFALIVSFPEVFGLLGGGLVSLALVYMVGKMIVEPVSYEDDYPPYR